MIHEVPLSHGIIWEKQQIVCVCVCFVALLHIIGRKGPNDGSIISWSAVAGVVGECNKKFMSDRTQVIIWRGGEKNYTREQKKFTRNKKMMHKPKKNIMHRIRDTTQGLPPHKQGEKDKPRWKSDTRFFFVVDDDDGWVAWY